jgi:hypothetical protein
VLVIPQFGAASVPALRSFVRRGGRTDCWLFAAANMPFFLTQWLQYSAVLNGLQSASSPEPVCQADPEVRQLATSIGFNCRASEV